MAESKHDVQHLTVIKELDKLKHDVIDHAISDTEDPKVKEEAKKLAYRKMIQKLAKK